MQAAAPCPGPLGITRRNMLQAGGIAALNLTLPQLLASDRQRASTASADACILVFLNGGPSHLDTWDMKPDLPREMRSEFSPIATSVPEIQVCEHLPRLARRMSRVSLVRSVYHDQVAHAPAVYTALTGAKAVVRAGLLGAKPTDHPSIGSVVGRYRPPTESVMPYVLMPHLTTEGAGGPPQPGFLAGILGKTHDPFQVQQNGGSAQLIMPALSPSADIQAQRVENRRRLLGELNPAASAGVGQAQEMRRFQERAIDLLTSPAAQRAFRLEQEPVQVRETYGRNLYGQCLLLARRLVEAGTRLACVSWAPNANATWDTHGANFTKLKNDLLPPFDQSISALLDDLETRGLLERTLVVVMGEIGRTPRINNNAGRDHWEFCYTVLLAGGGVKRGFTFGSSDRRGAYPNSSPVTATDVVATIYHALGIPTDLEIHDRQNRPTFLVPNGTPIHGVFA